MARSSASGGQQGRPAKTRDGKKVWGDPNRKTPPDYAKAVDDMVHLSSKSVNTKVTVGVRLSPDQLVQAPYAAVCTMRSIDAVPMDYVSDARLARCCAQIRAVRSGREHEVFADVIAADVAAIRNLDSRFQAGRSFGVDSVDPRLRQVLWPVGKDHYVALTPLHSTGFSSELRARLTHERERAPHDRAAKGANEAQVDSHDMAPAETDSGEDAPRQYRRTVVVPYGGSNSQNIGAFAFEMRSPLFFAPPREKPEVRRALALHHQGMPLDVARKAIDAFALWRHEWKKTRKSNLKVRTAEVDHLLAIAHTTRSIAEANTALLDRYREVLGTRVSDKVDPLLRALLDPQERSATFAKEIAMALLRRVAECEYVVDGLKYTIANHEDLLSYTTQVEGVFR